MNSSLISIWVIGILTLGIAISGCVAPEGNLTTPPETTLFPTITGIPLSPTSPVPPSPSGLPQVFILLPEFDAGIPAGDVTVVVQITGFRLVDPNGRKNMSGEGHLIYYLDVVPPTNPLRPAFTAPGTYASTPNTTYTWHHVTPDTHTFAVQLVNNDDTPLNPPVITANDVTAV